MDSTWSFVRSIVQLDKELFHSTCYVFIFFAFTSGISLQFFAAPYGRYFRRGWGPAVNARLSWFLWELPSICVPLVLLLFTSPKRMHSPPNIILLGCFLIHYIHRALIYPFLIKGGKPSSLFQILVGFVYCLINGYLQCGYIMEHADFGSTWKNAVYFYTGLVLFFTGLFVNVQSDHILRTLRKPGETCYKIPQDGMFRYVSGANFFGEIVEWLGFAVANRTLPAFTFFLFTACAIGPRAFQHHRWYKEKFEDYPKERKALIPFII